MNADDLLLGVVNQKLRWRDNAAKEATQETSLASTNSNMAAMMEFAFKMGQQQSQTGSSGSSSSTRCSKPVLALEDKKPSSDELEASHQLNCFWEEAIIFYCVLLQT